MTAWPSSDARFEDATSIVKVVGQSPRPLADLGLRRALALWRPFLTYSELSGLITDRSSQIFDQIDPILGLDDFTATEKRLSRKHSDLAKEFTTVRNARLALVTTLQGCADPRAARIIAALGNQQSRSWKLDEAQAVALATSGHSQLAADVAGAASPGGVADGSAWLRRLVDLPVASVETVAARADELRAAAQRLAGLAGTAADDARRLAGLLRAGLEHHTAHGDGPCPLCHTGTLDEAWRQSAAAEADRLAAQAADADAAHAAVTSALTAARMLECQELGSHGGGRHGGVHVLPHRAQRGLQREPQEPGAGPRPQTGALREPLPEQPIRGGQILGRLSVHGRARGAVGGHSVSSFSMRTRVSVTSAL